MHFIDQYLNIKHSLILQNRNYLTKDEYILLKKISYNVYFSFDKFITDLIKKYELNYKH